MGIVGLALGLAMPFAASAQGTVNTDHVAAATVACVTAFTDRPAPLAYVPVSEWKIKRRTKRIGGERREFFEAEHRAMNLRLQYEPGQSCSVYAIIPAQVPASNGGDAASSTVLIGRTSEALADRHPSSGVREENESYSVLVSDQFEIDFTYVGSGFDDNLFYLIIVRAPKSASAD